MRVLVTGAAGMLGVDLVGHLQASHDVIGIDIDEIDITDAGSVAGCVADVRPDVVFHCAAWTAVDAAEADEGAARRVNEDGSRNVARASARRGARLIALSTDYVFSGDAPAYDEDAPVGPRNAYGRTKLAGERAVLAEHPGGTRIARTAWLYGAHGRNFVDTMRRLGVENEVVRVVADQEGCPTWTVDLAGGLAALVDQPPGIYHLAGGGSVTWAGLAEAVFAIAGIDCRVEPVASAEFPQAAHRPTYSVLSVTRPGAPKLRHWRDALTDYLTKDVTQ
jgi:dTDP-4-dehydrorhamnose reductase